MLQKSFMRRGVSLEVILEEDDNAEVSFDPTPFEEETDSNSSSPASSSGREGNQGEEKAKRGPLNNFDRLREEERRKRRREEEEELWRGLEKQRSLSCETLTILDVGDDEFSREQWEEEARDWGVAEGTNGGHQIEHSISRKKILLQATSRSSGVDDDDQYDSEPDNRETLSEDELETASSSRTKQSGKGENRQKGGSADAGKSWNPDGDEHVQSNLKGDYENRSDLPALRQREDDAKPNTVNLVPTVGRKQSEISPNGTSPKTCSSDTTDEREILRDDSLVCNRFPVGGVFDPLYQESLPNDEDSWITVGELETGSSLSDNNETAYDTDAASKSDTVGVVPKPTEEEEKGKGKKEAAQQPSRHKSKGVRFREEPEYVNERAELVFIDDYNDDEDDNARTSSDNRQQRFGSPLQEEIPHLLDVKAGRELFEASSGEGRTDFPPIYDRLPTALENTRVLIVEKPLSQSGQTDVMGCPVPPSTLRMETNVPSSPSSSSSSSLTSFNAHNVEVHLEELPPPHTVASVRQLFEHIPAAVTLHSDTVFDFQSRFDHVRSNPSSKILRFDRDRRFSSSPPLGSRSTSSASSSSSLPKNFRGEEAGRSPLKKRLSSSVSRPAEDYCSTGVHLRKPRVARGFDVRKALRENPRYFHIRVGEKSKDGDGAKLQDKSTGTKTPSGKGTITYSYVEAKHQSQRGSTTTLRWTKETIDRSDAESMSSESSEDSGVSKDFSSSSIITSFSKSTSGNKKAMRWNCPDLVDKQFASDPSFKWIDPAVLAKIRARGTTVIYFGPRHRAPGGAPRTKAAPWWNPTLKGNVLEGNKSPASTLTQIIEREDENELERGRGGVHTHATQSSSSVRDAPPNTQVSFAKKVSYTPGDSPKIVGVKHKRGMASTSRARSSRTPDHDMPPRLKPFLHRDSIFLPKREAKNKSKGNNSIIYDFTQREPQQDDDDEQHFS